MSDNNFDLVVRCLLFPGTEEPSSPNLLDDLKPDADELISPNLLDDFAGFGLASLNAPAPCEPAQPTVGAHAPPGNRSRRFVGPELKLNRRQLLDKLNVYFKSPVFAEDNPHLSVEQLLEMTVLGDDGFIHVSHTHSIFCTRGVPGCAIIHKQSEGYRAVVALPGMVRIYMYRLLAYLAGKTPTITDPTDDRFGNQSISHLHQRLTSRFDCNPNNFCWESMTVSFLQGMRSCCSTAQSGRFGSGADSC